MKPETKSFLKKLLLANLIAIGVVLGMGLIFVVPNCTYDCFERGELIGRGLVYLLLSLNLVAYLIHHFRKRK